MNTATQLLTEALKRIQILQRLDGECEIIISKIEAFLALPDDDDFQVVIKPLNIRADKLVIHEGVIFEVFDGRLDVRVKK